MCVSRSLITVFPHENNPPPLVRSHRPPRPGPRNLAAQIKVDLQNGRETTSKDFL